MVIPTLDLHISVHSIWWSLVMQYLLYGVDCSTPLTIITLVIDLESNHWLTLIHHHNPDWFSQYVPLILVIVVENEIQHLLKMEELHCDDSVLLNLHNSIVLLTWRFTRFSRLNRNSTVNILNNSENHFLDSNNVLWKKYLHSFVIGFTNNIPFSFFTSNNSFNTQNTLQNIFFVL